MKEFLKNKTITYNLMSFTGFKALVIFSLLVESPKSYNEIADYFTNHPYLKESISIDTLRVYMNSLRRVGCEIKRIREDKISKYVISSNPFELNITQNQINSISKIYKSIIKNIDIHEVVMIEKFLKKISENLKNEELAESFKKISMLKGIRLNMLSELVDYSDKKAQIKINYNSPSSGVNDIEILTDKVEYKNNKFYLYGTGFNYMQYGSFLVSRITSIKEIKLRPVKLSNIKETTVGYEYKCGIDRFIPEDNEKLISVDEDKLLIEITSSNEFFIQQRLLELGPECKILYPEEFKNDFILRLKDMKAGYYLE